MHAKHCAKAQSLKVHHYVRDDKFQLFFTGDGNAFLAGKIQQAPALSWFDHDVPGRYQSSQLFYLAAYRIVCFFFSFFFFPHFSLRAEGWGCHAVTMMNTKADVAQA
jgi:hypothetical protein